LRILQAKRDEIWNLSYLFMPREPELGIRWPLESSKRYATPKGYAEFTSISGGNVTFW
jgi:hypothetical protein